MECLKRYHLYLLDLDGLLVNTEQLHYEAYLQMCAARGFHLELTFGEYCEIAHRSAVGIAQRIYEQFPKLHAQEPDWSVLYAEKKAAYVRLLRTRPMTMMPGASELLYALAEASVKRCVVTHSAADLAESLRAYHPALQTVPYWLTRESYKNPKPDPECYQKAIALFAEPSDKVIGFEDSPRGLQALSGTRADRVLVNSSESPCLPVGGLQGALHFSSLQHYLDSQKQLEIL